MSAFDGGAGVSAFDVGAFDASALDMSAFDASQSWAQRSAMESHLAELMDAIGAHPAVASIERGGLRLIDFAEYRLRLEVARLLRGWTLAGTVAGRRGTVAGRGTTAEVWRLVCDPTLSAALLMGVRAGLGLDARPVPYVLPEALAGPPLRRAVARQAMRGLAAASRPRRGRVRVAVVAAGKLALALDSLSDAELRAAGVGLMPFPGLDHGNGLLLALRRRLPLLGSYGAVPRGAGSGTGTGLPARFGLEADPGLDGALALLVSRVLAGAAAELDQAVEAVKALGRARALRALLLPSAAYGASRVLIEWAHAHGLRVGAMQHGIYTSRGLDGGDRRADLLLGWGQGTGAQIAGWPEPRPAVRVVGVPGLGAARTRTVLRAGEPAVRGEPALRRVLVATSSTIETPLVPARFCEEFIETIAPGLKQLRRAGVEVELRPHPGEEPERYGRLLAGRGLDVGIAEGGPFAQAIAGVDILISSASSVAFEAARMGLGVLLWPGPAPGWVRERHLVEPWSLSVPGMFVTAAELEALVQELIERPAAGLRVAHGLSACLARYAEPFDAARFAQALLELGSGRSV